MMGLTIARVDDASGAVSSLSLSGVVDLSTRQELLDRGLAVLAEDRSVTLDLSSVEFMDSTGIGALVHLAKACERQGKSFAISAVSPRVQRVLEVTGLADAWPVD